MTVFAQKRLKVGHDAATDTPVYRYVGEVVPEAESWDWRTIAALERANYIKDIPDAASAPAVAALAPKPEPKGSARARKD